MSFVNDNDFRLYRINCLYQIMSDSGLFRFVVEYIGMLSIMQTV